MTLHMNRILLAIFFLMQLPVSAFAENLTDFILTANAAERQLWELYDVCWKAEYGSSRNDDPDDRDTMVIVRAIRGSPKNN